MDSLDAEAKRVRNLLDHSDDAFPVCLLGKSGIGKSTIINSLIFGNESYLPSCGIGPLTAQALSVSYAGKPSFAAEYHSRRKIWNLAFGLAQSHKDQLPFNFLDKANRPSNNPDKSGDGRATDQAGEKQPQDEITADHDSEEVSFLVKQARLLVTDSQDEERSVAYLLDSLQLMRGEDSVYGSDIKEDDQIRIDYIKSIINDKNSRRTRSFTEEGRTEFLNQINAHATGFLAPLIRKLELKWNKDILSNGLTLVDLPGVGIAEINTN